MTNNLTAKAATNINVPVSKVWKAFTDPAMIREYLFGTNTISDWKKGSPITYTGEWEGKKYEDKGVIVEIIPEKILHTTYLSGMSGKEDKAENYANVIYKVSPDDGHSLVTITQDNIEDEAQLKHMQDNWSKVLESMKKLLEERG